MPDVKLQFNSMNDLIQKAKIDLVGKPPHKVYDRLPLMQKKSNEARQSGDDETAYIMLKRWLDTAEWLKRSQNYRSKSIQSVNINITTEQVGNNICIAKTIRLQSHCSRQQIYMNVCILDK